jgi:hypothetical protein
MSFAAAPRFFAVTRSVVSFRSALVYCATAAALVIVPGNAPAATPAAAPAANRKIALTADPVGSRQVRVVVEVTGDLKVNPDGKEMRHLPITVQAEQVFVERSLTDNTGKGPSRVRYYRTAEANLKLKDTELPQTLREERRHIIVQATDGRPALFSPLGPLAREELELLDVPGATLPLTALLPTQPVAVGDTWKIADATLARLLCLDMIHQQNVECKLASVDKEVAIIAISGKASGAVEGISSDVELIAKCNFDLRQKCVTWLALAIKENRAVGHAQPGFETVSKIRLVAAPTEAATELSEKSLAGLPLHGQAGEMLVELISKQGGFGLLHDRRWRVMVDQHDATILRLVDRGDLIAQCNISKLPPLEDNAQLTMEGLQQDIEKSLGKNFGSIVEASAQVNGQDVRVLRVVVAGVASELPIQWTYYHLSDNEGNRASIVFTIESKLVERFAAIDGEFISAFRFLPKATEEESSPIKPVESASKGTSVLKK